MAGALRVQSNIRDLLMLYNRFMEAAGDQQSNDTTSTPNNRLQQLKSLTEAYIPLSPNDSGPGRSCAIGWVRAELPSMPGVIDLNPAYIGEMPIVGKGLEKPTLCLYHQGSNNAFLWFVQLMPESHTAIVLLTNSMANNDAADWVGQLILETVLDNPDKNDYLKLPEVSAAESKAYWVRLVQEIEQKRQPDTPLRPLDAYCGAYCNRIGTYCVDVFTDGEILKMCFQGCREWSYTRNTS